MKRPLALLALALPPLFAAFSFVACGTDDSPASSVNQDPALADCSSPPLCDPIVLPAGCSFLNDAITCTAVAPGPDGGDADAGTADAGPPNPLLPARVQCALEALRDRKTGGLSLLMDDPGSKTCGIRVEILSFGDGTASVLPASYCDLDVVRGEGERRAVQPVKFFDDCLASTDLTKRVECLTTAISTKTASGGTCSCRGISADTFRGPCN
jgi:hypothetical protein